MQVSCVCSVQQTTAEDFFFPARNSQNWSLDTNRDMKMSGNKNFELSEERNHLAGGIAQQNQVPKGEARSSADSVEFVKGPTTSEQNSQAIHSQQEELSADFTKHLSISDNRAGKNGVSLDYDEGKSYADEAAYFRIRSGDPASEADFKIAMNLLDKAVLWLAARGRTNQWGDTPFSETPGGSDRMRNVFAHPSNVMRVAEMLVNATSESTKSSDAILGADSGTEKEGHSHIQWTPVGVCMLGEKMEYSPTVDEEEVYVRLLVTDRDMVGKNIGSKLMKDAEQWVRAERKNVQLMRVDCFGGGDRKLVAYYEKQGYKPSVGFQVKGVWPAQVLEKRLC